MLPSNTVLAKKDTHYGKIRSKTPTVVCSDSTTDCSRQPSAEDIKQSKDRINALRNIFPFYSQIKNKIRVTPDIQTQTESDDVNLTQDVVEKTLKENSNDDEEKDKCEGSDSESLQSISEVKSKSIVHSRIASYELPYKGNDIAIQKSFLWGHKVAATDVTENLDLKCNSDDSCPYAKINKGRLSSFKERYQNSLTNFAYEGFNFGAKSNDVDKKYKEVSENEDGSLVSPMLSSRDDQLMYQLQSKIDSLESPKSNTEDLSKTSNIIIGNKDVLKLLSNKHLANLNIRVEKHDHGKKENRWRDGSFRASKTNIRSSFRSSKRKKKPSKHKLPSSNFNNFEEKGTSDSTLKENESESDDEVFRKVSTKVNIPSAEYIKKKFPEYAKVNKRKNIITPEIDVPSRSLSTSPIERAPVVKKICSSGTRLKKDSEPSLMVNPVKKADSFKSSRVTRRNSFLYNTRAKATKDSNDQESFVKTQAVRLRKRNSRNSKNSEYRVSVTIRPSTVANLANKFNTIILENQNGKTSVKSDVSFGGSVSVVGATKVPRYYSSPRASFKRKYRHKASKASKETKESAKKEKELTAIDNSIYYAEDLAANRRSLNNSLAELNMKDLFEDPDYNKTDEEKVCEKIKTALSSGKFKGETDDSEDDLCSKKINDEEGIEKEQELLELPLEEKDKTQELDDAKVTKDGHSKTDSIDSGISADEEMRTCRKSEKQSLKLESIISEDEKEINAGISKSATKSQDYISEGEDKPETIDNNENKEFSSLETAKSIDSGISLNQRPANEEEDNSEEETKDENFPVNQESTVEEKCLLESTKDDSHSEVSSVYSDVKGKKFVNDVGIYSSLLAAVKNTVKKNKDSDRKGDKDRKTKKFSSNEKDKWYKRNKSKERRQKEEELKSKKESKIYEKWTFKRKNRTKSKERTVEDDCNAAGSRNVTSDTDDDKYATDSEVYQDCSITSDQEESLYGNLNFDCRSRSREKRIDTKILNEENGKPSVAVTLKSIVIEEKENSIDNKHMFIDQHADRIVPVPMLNLDKDIEKLESHDNEQIYEPHTPTKKLPPPPKTPIPSPPSTFKRLLGKNRMKSGAPKKKLDTIYSDSNLSKDKTETTENIYENLYSPDLKKLKRNREKLEDQGIQPNSSFLWSESAIATAQATVAKANQEKVYDTSSDPRMIPSCNNVESAVDSYDKIGSPSLSKKFNVEDSVLEGHNYTEIQNNSSGDSQTIAYDDVGAPSAVSYDKIAAPSSSCGYDDIRPPSSQDLDIYKTSSEGYDPVNPPKSDSSQYDECDGGVVMAQLAVVREDQTDSLSYLYDDISMYNASIASHSYEPVCPPDQPVISVITEVPEKEKLNDSSYKLADVTEDAPLDSDGSDYGPHEVFSYKLTQVGVLSKAFQTNSKISNMNDEHLRTNVYDHQKRPLIKIMSDNNGIHYKTKNEESSNETNLRRIRKTSQYPSRRLALLEKDVNSWEDVSESEKEEEQEIPVTIKTRIPIIRKERPKRVARFRVNKKSWTQGVRDVAASNYRVPHAHKNGSSSNLVKIQPRTTHITHTRSHTHIRTNTDHVITYSWRQKPSGDLDGILRWQNVVSPPVRTPSKLSTSSKSSSSSSSSSYKSLSSSSASSSSCSSFSSNSSCTLPSTPSFKDEEQVYVTSSSTIILLGCATDDTSNTYDTAYETPYYNASTVSSCGTNDYESAKIRSIYYEDDNSNEMQEISCYVEEGTDSDTEQDNGGHYEAIYEVISPADDDKVIDDLPEEELSFDGDPQGHADDDSFDSDDSDEAYSRLKPQYLDGCSSMSRDRGESFSSDLSTEKCQDYLRHKYNRSQSQPPHSINKIAEAANLGMKRLRRNWSSTKNEVRTGLSKMKKKSNMSLMDIKSTEDILSEVNNTPSNCDKAKWSLKSHFRRKSITSILPATLSTPSPDAEKDKATFYLTLTIASDRQDTEEGGQGSTKLVRRKSNTPSVSSVGTTTSCDTSVSSRGRPLSSHGSALFRNTSSGSNSGSIFRPKTAPPAPPMDALDMEEETSKDKLAQRLNQLLSAAPIVPPGKRVMRSGDNSSSETSPVPLLVHAEERLHSPKSLSSLHLAKGRQLAGEVTNSVKLNAPHTRASVASSSSHGSMEGYIRPSDIASAPPPLPARPTSISGSHSLKRQSIPHPPTISPPIMVSGTSDVDTRSYLDLNCEPNHETEPSYMSSHFADEPLYQFYTAKVERAALYQGESSEDDYEVINDGGLNMIPSTPCRPTAMELVTPTDGRRTLWCELPEVVSSGVLSKISSQERKIQEAMFEVITSEASYLKSLEVLVTHFMNCPEFSRTDNLVISQRDKNVLFSDILPVKKCSELFLADLEKRWQESYIISGITDIILKHSTSSFNVYVKYCSNQIYQDRKLRDLKENNPRFMEVLTRLESSPICQSLAMHSFLMLPMQRITRLPLLLDAIFNRLEYGSAQWQECKCALTSLTKIVAECNEGARKMERMEEMLLVSHQLDFREVKAIPLISASRWLVKKGEVTRLTWKEGDAKLTFGRKISKHLLYFFLFTDLLVVTKKKSEDQHMVLDYCPRNMVQVLELESADKFPGRLLDGHKNLIIMTMLQNHENKTVEMVLSCPLESNRTRWMEAVTPRISENPDERIYEEWDCPQVQVVHSYASTQPDEVSLEVSDVINVLKKTSDGWYQGERLRDGTRGWFPGNHTVEIASAHVRARNLRQRYRLLAISGSIIDELKKEKEKFEKEEKKKERRRTITIKEVL